MSDYPMLISNKLHSFRNFVTQIWKEVTSKVDFRNSFLPFVLGNELPLLQIHII